MFNGDSLRRNESEAHDRHGYRRGYRSINIQTGLITSQFSQTCRLRL